MSETTLWGTAVVAAPWPGPRGQQGATGPPAPDAPADDTTYGRAPDQWVPVLPLSGGTLSNGLSFGSAVAGDAGVPSRHVYLYESGTNRSGLTIIGGTLVHASFAGGVWANWRFFTGGGQLGLVVNDHTTAQSSHVLGGDVLAGGSFSYDKSTGRLTMRGGGGQWAGDAVTGWGQQAVNLSGLWVTGELWCAGLGLRSSASGWASWRWDGAWILFRWNQAYEWPMANACDERLKQDIVPSTFDALSVVRRIRLYQFRWNMKQRRDAAPIGFVAQRLAEDFPHGAVVRAGKVRGARLVGSTDVNTMLAALVRAVQQLDERANELRSTS